MGSLGPGCGRFPVPPEERHGVRAASRVTRRCRNPDRYDDALARSAAMWLSGYCCPEDDDTARRQVDPIIYDVCTDALVLLLTLNDFVTAPVTFEAIHGRARCSVLVKRAQAVLGSPILLLSEIVQRGRYCAAMESAEETLEHHRNRRGTPGLSPKGSGSAFRDSEAIAETSLRGDGNFKQTESSLDNKEGQIKESLAAVARGLRSIAAVFRKRPLHEQLLNGHGSRWPSPDVLVSLAGWMETVTRYTFWNEPPYLDIRSAGKTQRRGADHSLTIFARSRSSKNKLPPKMPGSDGDIPQTLPRAITNEHGISTLRWKAACLGYKISDLFSPREPGSTFTINNSYTRTSSFDSFPIAMTSPPPSITTLTTLLNQTIPLLPATLQSFYYAHLHPSLTRLRAAPIWAPLFDTHSPSTPEIGATTTTTPTRTTPISIPFASTGPYTQPQTQTHLMKAALFSRGYRTAFIYLLTAATLAHIRRILVPWMGQYTWHAHPLDDLRLAISNPEVFIDEMLGYDWGWMVGGYLLKAGFDVFGGWLGWLLCGAHAVEGGSGIDMGGDWERGMDVDVSERRYMDVSRSGNGRGFMAVRKERQRTRGQKVWLEVISVGFLVWVLVTVEYVFARGMNTSAWLVACYKLLTGGEVGRFALGRVLEGNWVTIPLVVWQLGYYLKAGVGPLAWRSVRCAARGQPGLFMAVMGAVGGVWMLLRYRSTVFIALEVSGVFVFLGYLLAGLVVLGREFLADPLELNASTALARATGQRARGMLPQGADSRTKITVNKTKGMVGASSQPDDNTRENIKGEEDCTF